MLTKLHERLGYGNLKFEYYNDLLEKYSYKKQAFILIAFKNEIPISGVFILGNKNYMHYYKGASQIDLKNEGHGELLQWEAIKISKKLGSAKYDLCNISKDKLPDIYLFKTGFSKDTFQYQNYTNSALGYRIANRFVKIIRS